MINSNLNLEKQWIQLRRRIFSEFSLSKDPTFLQ
jgi:hypothetical protein